jgi:peptidoglycan/xylan/chitin deacetylase (PgdA/CDA1 family)
MNLGRSAGRLLGCAAGAQILPAATWLPRVRARLPSLSGIGASDHVALTFDDGPDSRATPQFLDLLRAHDVRATFFLVGERISRAPDVVRRMVDEGHEIGVHGWRHQYTLVASPRLERCVDALADVCGARPQWFRPPYGVLSASALVEARRCGLRPVLWTAWAKDWRADATAESVRAMLEPGIVGGATLLLHDSGSAQTPMTWTSALGALPEVLALCAERGLRVGPLADHGVR